MLCRRADRLTNSSPTGVGEGNVFETSRKLLATVRFGSSVDTSGSTPDAGVLRLHQVSARLAVRELISEPDSPQLIGGARPQQWGLALSRRTST